MGIGELYALICAVCWALAVILFKHAGNSLTAQGLNLTKNVIGAALLVPTAFVIEGLNFPQLLIVFYTDVFDINSSGKSGTPGC